MRNTEAADILGEAVHSFMPAFMVHLNPLLHHTRYRGRSYSELEVKVVLGLSLMGPLRPAWLSRDLAIEKGSLTTVIRRLVDLGLISREVVPGDARGYLIALTADGDALVSHLAEQRLRGFRALFSDMPLDRLDEAAHGLALLTDHLSRARSDSASPIG